MELFERLREERDRLGFSQEKFSAAGGVLKRAQIHYEKGERMPDASYLAAIAEIGVDVVYVLTGRRDDGVPALGASERVLIDSYRSCPSEARQNLLQTAVLLAAGVAPPTSKKPARSKVTVTADGGYAAGRDMTLRGNPKELGSEKKANGRKPAGPRSRA